MTVETHYLHCVCCGDEMFGRAAPEWYEDDTETCPDCGCVNRISIDDHDETPTADTVIACGDVCACEECPG